MSNRNSEKINLSVNGCNSEVRCDYTTPLADVLREQLNLTGTKVGCRTGECGACTIIMDGKPVVSCLIPAASAEGHQIQTIESLSEKDQFQMLVQAMLEKGGVQCGFCTPGIMNTLWAWMEDRTLFNGDIKQALKNNLCRCTGYLSIVEAVEKVVAQLEGGTSNVKS